MLLFCILFVCVNQILAQTETIKPCNEIIECKTSAFDYTKLPDFSGVVFTNSFAPILEKPEMLCSKVIGLANDFSKEGYAKVTIISKVNCQYYKVKCGDVEGYMFVIWLLITEKDYLSSKK